MNAALAAMNIGAEVYWPQRQASGLDGTGIISGIIWDVDCYGDLWGLKENGVVVEFMYRESLVHFYVSMSNMERAWRGDRFEITTQMVQFLDIQDITRKRIEPHLGLFAYCVSNSQRVPVWTPFLWSVPT